MGSCISKCSRKRKREEESVTVQDKLVISQAPLAMNFPPKISTKQNVVQPLSPSSTSTSSDSSLSCTIRTNTSAPCSIASTLSSSSSCLSSTLSSKERSFSNEFLWACVKENPQIIYTDLAKGSPQKTVPTKAPLAKKLGTSTAQKRARASSPTLSRQKSFRRDHTTERPNNSPSYSLPNRALRSPSPSRRFTNSTAKESCSRSTTTSTISRASPKGVNLRPPSPSKSNFSKELRPCLVNREMSSAYRNINGGEVVSKQDMEDIDNPLIALDCFIFL
ncbi:uncharacterized serine-rich protein C215.13 [Diospyros lotus]|uniref:uncharacterized serine-rich protein C215.13 n=1 Tax=Diospyros lotus TaxID=55363 RepID=UPI00225AA01A|nr:uncharacterized serine-rich protein C215.13 [Diospyros lotus]